MKKLTDKEKVVMVIGYLKGLIGDSEYAVIVNPKSVKEFIKEIENND